MPRKRSNTAESDAPTEDVPAEDQVSEEQPAATADDGEASLELDRSLAAEKEASELREQLLRKQAEFENYRKRMSRDKDESVRYANSALLLELTAVIDDFERAIRSSEESRDFDTFHEGIVMIERQLVSTLEKKWGLAGFDSVGEPFDPEIHRAMAAEEREDFEESVVLEEFQKGYRLHDRVLRPAAVKVSAPPPSANGSEEEATDTADSDTSAVDED